MIDLHSIVLNLKPKEKDFIQKFYTVEFGKNSKKLKLFNLVSADHKITNTTVAQILYNKKPNSTYSQLKKRLKNDMLHFFLFFEKEEESVDKRDTAKIKCINLILQSDILNKRGLFEECLNTLKKAEVIALKYEFFELQLTINDKFLGFYEINGELEQLDKYRKKTQQSQIYLNQYMRIKNYYQEVKLFEFQESLNHNNRKKESLKNRKLIINKLRLVRHYNYLPSIKYWYFQALMQFYISIKKYEEASKFSIYSIRIIEEYNWLFSDSELAKIYLDSAKLNIYLHEYDSSIQNAGKVLQKEENKDHIKIMAYELFFHAHMGKKEHEKALDMVSVIEKNYMKTVNNSLLYKWLYFKANVRFIQKDYRESMKLLQQISKSKYDISFIICLKILELMIIAEFKDYKWYENKIDNLRKLFSRYKNSGIQRSLKIFKVLKSLLNTNFNFEETLQLETENLTSIYNKYSFHSWNPLEYEIIRMDEWLMRKR